MAISEAKMADLVYVPPSRQSAQGPVPKPGEPVNPTKGILAEPTQKAGTPEPGADQVPEVPPPPPQATPQPPEPKTEPVQPRSSSSSFLRLKK